MRIVVLGLSITSSWGNGHATTYRALLGGLHQRGHRILFLERDKPWYRENRDLAEVPFAEVALYDSLEDLAARFTSAVMNADLVIVGSYVPEGVGVIDWVTQTARGVTAFYDIDTPVTLSKLGRGDEEYLAARQIPRLGLYLSFTGGPTLRRIERRWGAKMAHALYCSVDPEMYLPEPRKLCWSFGYLGTYSADRQPALEELLLQPARELPSDRFAIAGPLYPPDLVWPPNVDRTEHLPPSEHRAFYNSQKFTLNVTRVDMRDAGYSPSVRLFEAGACGTAIVSDHWAGIEEIFTPGEEILVAKSAEDVLRLLREMPESDRTALGRKARERVLREHTALHRARELERCVEKYRSSASPVLVGNRV